ncbi:hypothetical protein [Adhaeribacter rhizoryzae]|uniref:Uncharacterized protein n=1 Tax=Adhaeribacter rhizoryzae TaxID=2607907 RepID=A0A5M6CXA6_9BACT|nr:hypothetical protein [Adhaeribacter rhizoryzae]KAA5538622.1 hypothetical protein F0145_25845 [Adhaeribacter rhizoryzae]
MLTQAFSKLLLVIDYQANKAFITEFLCINKNKPELHCNGHCFLKKNLKEAEEAEKHSTNPTQEINITLFYQPFFRIAPVTYFSPVNYLIATLSLYQFTRLLDSFHPPQVTV